MTTITNKRGNIIGYFEPDEDRLRLYGGSQKHRKDEYGDWVCPADCGFTSSARGTTTVSEHYRRQHKFYHAYRCGSCSDRFNSRSDLNRHYNKNHSRKQNRHYCKADGCSFSAKQEGQVQTHYGRKHVDRIYYYRIDDGYECCGCRTVKSSEGPMFYHLATCFGPYSQTYKRRFAQNAY